MKSNYSPISLFATPKAIQLMGIILLGGTLSGRADLLVYEGFEYPAGSLIGQSGGTGWHDVWHPWPGDTDPSHAGAVVNGSLKSSVPIATIGRHMETPDPDTPMTRAFEHPIFDTAGVTWVALLLRNDSTQIDGTYSHLSLSSSQDKKNSAILSIGKDYGSSNWGISSGARTGALSFSADNTVVLIVLRIEHSDTAGADSIQAFVNPPTATEPTIADAKIEGFTLKPADLVTIRSGSGKKIFSYDEFRVGTSFADVVPPSDDSR